MNIRYDIANNFPLLTLSGAAGTSSDNTAITLPSGSTGFDTRDNEAINIILIAGTLADADATFATTITESDTTNGTYAAVPATELSAALSTMNFIFSEDNIAKQISVKPTKRFVRVVVTPSANASAAPFSVAVQGTRAIVGTTA
jgi:hypothetical protein